jgi:ketosteroid isomerase-like protein
MSQENVEIALAVTTPVTVLDKTRRRTLDERFLVRFPALVGPLARVWSRLPPRSRLRRTWTSRIVSGACEAANRRDYDVLLLFLDPQIELDRSKSPLGDLFTTVHRGKDAYRGVWDTLGEAIENLRLEHEEVIDFGSRLLAAGRTTGRGSSSGVPVDEPIFQVLMLRRGLVIRQEDFSDRKKASKPPGCDTRAPSGASGPRDKEQWLALTTYQLFLPIAVAVGEANGDSQNGVVHDFPRGGPEEGSAVCETTAHAGQPSPRPRGPRGAPGSSSSSRSAVSPEAMQTRDRARRFASPRHLPNPGGTVPKLTAAALAVGKRSRDRVNGSSLR